MPKLKPTDLEQKRRTVRACVSSKRELNGWNDEQVAIKCRISPLTLHRRLKEPENFTLGELWGMGITIYIYDGQSRLPTDDGMVAVK